MVFSQRKKSTKKEYAHEKVCPTTDKNPSVISTRSALDEVLLEGAQKLLQEAIEFEVQWFKNLLIIGCKASKKILGRKQMAKPYLV